MLLPLILLGVIVAATVGQVVHFYPYLPDVVVSHWGPGGQLDAKSGFSLGHDHIGAGDHRIFCRNRVRASLHTETLVEYTAQRLLACP